MSDWVLVLSSPLLVAGVLALARKAAMDLDHRGQPGWVYGLLVLFVFPLGIAAWLLGRERYPVVEDVSMHPGPGVRR
jgi:hypothetical protein